MTNPTGNAVQLMDLDARRTAVEEMFRGANGTRYGLGMGPSRLATAARLGRLIQMLALAAILLVGPGPVPAGGVVSGNHPAEYSDLIVGRRAS